MGKWRIRRLRSSRSSFGYARQMPLDALQGGQFLRGITTSQQDLPGAFDLFQDIFRFSGPQVWFRLLIVLVDVDPYGLLQFRDRVKHTPPDTLIRHVAEEPLHLVQPGGTGGSEMHVKPRMLG